jgi:signal transduction histidine kinase
LVKSGHFSELKSSNVGESNIEDRLHELTHDLVERIKELNCLYGISRLVENEKISLDEILQGVADLIPPAWQYPEVTCARIKLRDREFKTANFQATIWKQEESISVNTRKVGTLEIYYLKEKPWAYEVPFLKEERDLVHGIAERLGHIIESKKGEITLHKLYSREKRLRTKLQLEMQNRVDFTRQLVHELKTPLTSLMATSQLLSEETQDTRLEKLAGYVLDGANRLNYRIEELHDIIRGEIGKLKIELKPVNIETLLAQLVGETKALSKLQGISIKLELKNRPLPKVLADKERVRQIMLNLINNACKYAAEGKEIIIRASQPVNSKAVIIEVQDFGPGIPQNIRRAIFKPGYQKIIQEGKPGGLGIGLPLCKVLVELHGGKIRLESILGKSSSFYFTLPVTRKAE